MLNYFDRGLLIVAVLALFISGKKILNNFFLEQLTQENVLDLNKKNELGAISSYNNDARYKPSHSFNWSKASTTQKIYQSDSIFVGSKSNVDVLLNDQSQIAIGENSLVVFNRIQQMDLANLKIGNFSLNVNGSVKLAIQDEVIEIKGKQTKIQIFIDKNKKVKPVIKTLAGKATVQYKKEKHELKQSEAFSLPTTPRSVASLAKEVPTDALASLALSEDPAKPSDILSTSNQPRVPFPKNEWSENYIYQWKLYDLYKLNGKNLTRNESIPAVLPIYYKLSWKNFPEMPQTTYVMVSDNKDFAQNFKLISTDKSELQLHDAMIGMNYWRISYDQQNWSITHQLRVTAQDRLEAPEMILQQNNIPFVKKSTFAEIQIDTIENTKGYVVESSTFNNFPQSLTNITWNKSEQLKVPITKPGILYVRARRVFTNTEVSSYSNIIRIDSYRKSEPRPVSVFQLASRNLQEKFPLTKKIQAQIAPVPLKMESRDPSAEAVEILSPVAMTPDEYWNDNWNATQFELEVGSFIASSSDQKLQNKDQASGLNAGFNFIKWWKSFGIRAHVQSKISDISETSIGSPMKIGLLYMKRLFSGGSVGRAQITGLAGFESYYNSGSTLYSPQYDLLKAGAALQLPLAYRWGLSGEALAGYGFDQSKRYELAGRVQYHFKRQMFLGAGYRMQLFEAGSTKSSPSDLPYREVMDEGYSLFGYQF